MKRLILFGAVGALVIGGAIWLWLGSSPDRQLDQQWAFLNRYCVDCHNDAEYTGNFSFEGMRPADVASHADLFEKAVRKLRVGMMPPGDATQPESDARYEFVAALESTLDAAVADEPYAGATPLHRLNRAEYANAIRDLLALEIDVEDLLPSDGGDFGFDNIAAALPTSPLLLERYLTAAQRISALAVGDAEAVPTAVSYKIPVDVTQSGYMEGLPLGTRGGMQVRHNFPADGNYIFSGRLLKAVLEGYYGLEGHDSPHEFVILVDGEQVYSAEIGGEQDHEVSSENVTNAFVMVDERMTSPRIPVSAGPHDVAFTWIERPTRDQSVWERSLRDTQEAHNTAGLPRLETGIIEGPYDVSGISDTPSRERIFVCRPASAEEEPACAEKVVSTLARRAFRRPVSEADLRAPLRFYNETRDAGGNFDKGVRAALARILVSPAFLYRAEADPVDLAPGSTHTISDIELASRLSFFLWSSIPDDELLDVAIGGQLREPEVLEAQVRRMVADDKAAALIENFTGQWLQLRNLEARVVPDLLLFPDFDDNLRKAFRRETEMLFASVLQEDRSVLDLLRADYTFVNERLARHYGIPGIYGTRFRRVELADPNRWGLLGHGSILSLTSAASRTSPIIRGKYLVSNFLNSPPPSPPAVVPALEESAPADRPSTVREQLELHRANPECNSCHRNLDPLGFALENFNATGQWRETDQHGLAIDSAGVLADGTPVDGPIELRNAMLARPEVFAGTVTEKLMIYALGRGLEPEDMPQVRRILRQASEDDYRMMSIIVGIVDSLPFQMRTKLAEPNADESIAQAME
jgi:hypothetical protein